MSIMSQVSKVAKNIETKVPPVVPHGILKRLKPSDIKPSKNNPRRLFDKVPLDELRESIRKHGVLVPIIVYEIKAQNKYAILDGERRYRCCIDLEKEGLDITIPANIVDPPDKMAGILYMFSIHNFREPWELMPTALSLKIVMEALGEEDSKPLAKLTGLSEPQIERCKKLLAFPEKFQNLSLEPDPKTRIPSNFWIEASPVIDLCEKILPKLMNKLGRDGITEKLVEKYRTKGVKSVIHFRRIMEAFEISTEDESRKKAVTERLREYITDVSLETRKAFDEFVMDSRRVQTAIKACEEFTTRLEHSKLEHALEREELMEALKRVKEYVEDLLQKLEGGDQPTQVYETKDEEGE
jgi:ParB family transcriptional regulator, chromosome partitioning protein